MSGLIKSKRIMVNGDVAIKPYLYVRNKMLHVRFTSDKCVALTESEESELYRRLTEHPEKKQEILAEFWSMTADMIERPVYDGIQVADRIMDEKRQSNGQ